MPEPTGFANFDYGKTDIWLKISRLNILTVSPIFGNRLRYSLQLHVTFQKVNVIGENAAQNGTNNPLL